MTGPEPVLVRCDACGQATPRRDLETKVVELGAPWPSGDMGMIYIHINASVCTARAKAKHRGIYSA